MNGVFFTFEIGGQREVVGVGGQEDIWRFVLAEPVWMRRDRNRENKW